MPVASGGPSPARQALTVGVAMALGALAIVFLVTRFDRLGGGGAAEVEVGDPVFVVGSAEDLAPVVAESGPFLFPGPTGAGRDLWVQHLGDDPGEGWSAFSVRADGASLDCVAEWQAASRTFVDSCDGEVFPEDGEGLQPYGASVDAGGDLVIDLSPLPDGG
jgi:hypothetical protein